MKCAFNFRMYIYVPCSWLLLLPHHQPQSHNTSRTTMNVVWEEKLKNKVVYTGSALYWSQHNYKAGKGTRSSCTLFIVTPILMMPPKKNWKASRVCKRARSTKCSVGDTFNGVKNIIMWCHSNCHISLTISNLFFSYPFTIN